MIILPILTTSPIHFTLNCWENLPFELGNERVKLAFVGRVTPGEVRTVHTLPPRSFVVFVRYSFRSFVRVIVCCHFFVNRKRFWPAWRATCSQCKPHSGRCRTNSAPNCSRSWGLGTSRRFVTSPYGSPTTRVVIMGKQLQQLFLSGVPVASTCTWRGCPYWAGWTCWVCLTCWTCLACLREFCPLSGGSPQRRDSTPAGEAQGYSVQQDWRKGSAGCGQ